MANLKEVRTRILSVTSTQQITGAMKMVSAAKLRKAQEAIKSFRPYAMGLTNLLGRLSAAPESSRGVYSQQRIPRQVLIVAITSNRGLCGAFNSNVIKQVNKLAYQKYKNQRVSVISIGKKAFDHYKKTELKIIGTNMPRKLHTLYDHLTFENVTPLAQKIMSAFAGHDFDGVDLVYNSFKNVSVQLLTTEQFLPIIPDKSPVKMPEGSQNSAFRSDYIYEPDRDELIKELIPRSLITRLYRAILESHAAEHGARMTAMHKATDNAAEILKDLRLSYNKARQAAITGEIIEIVSGAEALGN